MNDDVLEDRIRAKFRATAPLAVPEKVVIRAAAIPQTTQRRRSWPWTGPVAAGHLGLRLASAAAAVATVAVIGVMALSLLDGRGSVAGPGIPTLPPVIQPPLPSAAANPTTIRDGAWVSPTVAWLVDGQNRLRMTTDGGLTWSAPRPLPQDDLRGDPTFLDASFGFAMWARPGTDPVEVVLYATHDGGRTWASTTVGTLPTDDTNSLSAHFVDAFRGIVVAGSYHQGPVPSGSFGRGLTQAASAGWSTDDGGRTWASLPDAPCSNDDVWASAEVGLIFPVVDGGPRVSVTTDGGRTWRQGALPGVADSAFPAPAVFIVTDDGVPRLGYYVTKNTDRAGDPRTLIVAETRDGGATWQEAYETPTAGLSAVTAFGPGHWLTSGASAFGPGTLPRPILETADGGRTWLPVGTLGTIDGAVSGWSDRLHGMASGQDDSGCSLPSGTPCHSSGWFLTNDGGQTWHGVPF